MQYQEILNFWFEELSPKDWFTKSEKTDSLIRDRFSGVLKAAAACEVFEYRLTPEGRLAEILVLDQFSRNIHRGRPEAFACDTLALALAQEAVRNGCDRMLKLPLRTFFYMPYMHSESGLIHRQAVELFSQSGMENSLDFELRHKKIVEKIGRYPHRNSILGRESTAEEIEFLKLPGSGF